MKIGLIQCNPVTGDLEGNASRIVEKARKAAALGAELCVTPELALCGTAPRSLVYINGFGQASARALKDLAVALADCPPVIVGSLMPYSGKNGRQAVNAAILLRQGEFSLITRKVFQPYSPYGDEVKYFASGMSCGIMTIYGWRFGVVLCEDGFDEYSFWQMNRANAHEPLVDLISRGVDAIIQLTSSAFYAGSQAVRENMLSHVAARHHIHLFSVNLVGGNDGQIFSGQSLAFAPNGSLLARGRAFEEDLCVLDLSLPSTGAIAPAVASEEEELWLALVTGLRDYIRKSGFKKALVGLSGGLDSALVAAVAAEALGAENVDGLLMPSPYTSAKSIAYAGALAENLKIHTRTIALEPLMLAYEKALEPIFAEAPARPGDVTMENVQARIRGGLLMAIANRENRLVLNTGNKSEAAAGYCTLYGDGVGALSVIGDIPKTMVTRISLWLNEHHKKEIIPELIIHRPPTAELRANQLDSDSLPPYPELDAALARILGRNSPSASANDVPFDPLDQRVSSLILRSEYKRRQLPPTLRVSRQAFGHEFRLPVVSKFNGWSMPEPDED